MGNNSSRPRPPENWTHVVIIKTMDVKGGGTDGNIFVSFKDENGEETPNSKCDVKWKNDFEAGAVNYYYFNFLKLGKPTELRISRDAQFAADLWYVQQVEVECKTGAKSVFPVLRWLCASSAFSILENDCSLPQYERHPEQRLKELDRKRGIYELVPMDGLPAQVRELPSDEQFSRDYTVDIIGILAKSAIHSKIVHFFTPKIKKLQDYERLFMGAFFRKPYGILNWDSDAEFGNQRLSGTNPTVIKLCTRVPDHMPVTNDMVEKYLEGSTLQEAMNKKKIYSIDYRYLVDIVCNDDTKKLPGPTALFYSTKNGNLMPIAIQVMPESSDQNPIFTPETGDLKYTWLAAKMWFNLADSSHHQAVTHLGFTHLLMESFTVCTHRQLSPSHPIFKLLAPHFLYLLAINAAAREILVSKGGAVDQTMLMGGVGLLNIVKSCWKEWTLQDFASLPGDLKHRGVDDVDALPNYHYRDDGLLMWKAVKNYVTNVVNGHYDTSKKLVKDFEIQAWCKELSDSQWADLKGVPGKLENNDQLIEVLTCAIYIGSIGHAAANFSQYDEYAFAPNYPSALFEPPPTSKKPLTEADVIKLLPSKRGCLDMARVVMLLSSHGTNSISNFEIDYASDPIALQALDGFKAELKEVGKTIDERNKVRKRPYPYLHPDVVPNSISI